MDMVTRDSSKRRGTLGISANDSRHIRIRGYSLMRVRLLAHPDLEGWSGEFNTHALNEVIVYYEDGTMDSEFFHNLQVLLSNGVWMGFKEALGLHLIIPDNYNQRFREPQSELERERGWYD